MDYDYDHNHGHGHDHGHGSTTSSASTTNKRHGGAPSGMEPTTKKRAPYTSRACDACRRRKGRCSGDSPCTYCVARSLECTGAGGPSTYPGDGPNPEQPPPPPMGASTSSHSHSHSHAHSHSLPQPQSQPNSAPPASASLATAVPPPRTSKSTTTTTAPATRQLSSRPSISGTETGPESRQSQNSKSAEERYVPQKKVRGRVYTHLARDTPFSDSRLVVCGLQGHQILISQPLQDTEYPD